MVHCPKTWFCTRISMCFWPVWPMYTHYAIVQHHGSDVSHQDASNHIQYVVVPSRIHDGVFVCNCRSGGHHALLMHLWPAIAMFVTGRPASTSAPSMYDMTNKMKRVSEHARTVESVRALHQTSMPSANRLPVFSFPAELTLSIDQIIQRHFAPAFLLC